MLGFFARAPEECPVVENVGFWPDPEVPETIANFRFLG
jgi:hypothetical protein